MRDKRDVLLDFLSNPDAALNALHQEGYEIVPRYGHTVDELRDEFWQIALAIGCEPGDHGGTIDDIDVLSVITDQVRWNVQERERLNADGARLDEIDTVIAREGLTALLDMWAAARETFGADVPHLAHGERIRRLIERLK